MKYIVITGGVISGLGKGIVASSIGLLLKQCGCSVTAVKIDPYLNIDAGTMSPFEHGEVYVLEDGTETDLDLGNYERFLTITMRKEHNITSGKVFQRVINDEREGKYIGQTVQFIPHVTNTIAAMIHEAAKIVVGETPPDVCIVELGGTIGDMESMHFVEALRQMKDADPDNYCFVHVSPILGGTEEEKTKPTQHSVQEIRRLGIQPDILVVRSHLPVLSEKAKAKLHLHCQVPLSRIHMNTDVEHIYQVPEFLYKQGIITSVQQRLNMVDLVHPNDIFRYIPVGPKLKIAIVGKYIHENRDTYLSIHRALEHAAFKQNSQVCIVYLSSDTSNDLSLFDGVIIPGGFGSRGIEGMISTAKYCRKHNTPLLGICLGMQIMCIEAARNRTGLSACSSTEFNEHLNEQHRVVIAIEELEQTRLGGTMKLGAIPSKLIGKRILSIYEQSPCIQERHRHRYEINPAFRTSIEKDCLTVVGTDTQNHCIHVVEDCTRHFYIGCQFHPEYKSSLETPSPLFMAFVQTILAII